MRTCTSLTRFKQMYTTKIVDGYKMDIDRNLDENMLLFFCGYAFFLLRLSSACFDWLTICFNFFF